MTYVFLFIYLKYFSKHVRHMGVNEDDDLPINIKSTTPNKIFEMVESKRIDRQAFKI